MTSMADQPKLFPTKARLALLRAVEQGNVQHGVVYKVDRDFSYSPPRVVTARIRELERHGWVEYDGSLWWEPTEAGAAVLAKHTKEENR